MKSVIIFPSQKTLLRWLNFLLRSQSVILTVLLFWIYFSPDASICSAMDLPPLANSDYVFVSVSIDFPTNSQRDTLFHHIAYDYSCADWDGLCDYLRDVPCDDIFKLSASGASEFCEWVQVGTDVYIPHRKYQVKPHSSSWFSAACACHNGIPCFIT